MANLRTDNLYGVSGPDTNGSALFDGSNHLVAANAAAFRVNQGSTEDFTIEAWIYLTATPDGANARIASIYHTSGNQRSYMFYVHTDDQLKFNYASSGTAGSVSTLAGGTVPHNEWVHVAIAHEVSSTTLRLFKNGIEVATDNSPHTTYYANTSGDFTTGEDFTGNISNLHITLGTCKYTGDFTPSKHPIEEDSNTTVLCLNSSIDVLNDDKSNVFSQSAADGVKTSTLMPFSRNDDGVIFDGAISMNTPSYMYFPTGKTEERGRGRGVIFAGYSSPTGYTKDIYYLDIQSMGNAIKFGELISTRYASGAVASSTRGIVGGGRDPSGRINNIESVEIAITSNSIDFGDLTGVNAFNRGGGNQTRGIWMGGSNPSLVDTIEYVTIATKGNATDFGNMTAAINGPATGSSSTRMLAMGGSNPSSVATIDYIEIATTGNAQDFGDLTTAKSAGTGVSSNTRAVAIGGVGSPSLTNVMDFVTIATTGNATDFGDTVTPYEHTGSLSNSIRGVICGARTPSYLNIMESLTIATTGNSTDFGDIPRDNLAYVAGTSDSHGGLS